MVTSGFLVTQCIFYTFRKTKRRFSFLVNNFSIKNIDVIVVSFATIDILLKNGVFIIFTPWAETMTWCRRFFTQNKEKVWILGNREYGK